MSSPKFFKRLMAKLAVLSIVFSLSAPIAETAFAVDLQAGSNGTIFVNTDLANGNYQIFKLTDNSLAGSGPLVAGQGIAGTTFSIPGSTAPGTGYKIVFGAVNGLQPSDHYFNMISGASLSFTGVYIVDHYETLHVSTNIDNGNYQVFKLTDNSLMGSGPLVANHGIAGTDFNLISSPAPGTGYKIVFGDVDPTNFTKPADMFVNVITGQTPQAQLGVYSVSVIPHETLHVSTNIDNGNYQVFKLSDGSLEGMGPLVANHGIAGTDFSLPSSAAPGTGYKIVFGDVDPANFTKPADIFVNLITGRPESRTGEYSVSVIPHETLHVNTNIGNGNYQVFKLSNGALEGMGPLVAGQGIAGTDFSLPSSAAPGTGYKIVFGNVDPANFTKPADMFVNLITGQPENRTGVYNQNAQSGGIIITVVTLDAHNNEIPISNGSWEVKTCSGPNLNTQCPTSYSIGTAGATLSNVPLGMYGIFAYPAAGYATPYVTTVNPGTVTAGGTVNMHVVYPQVQVDFNCTINATTTPVAGNIFMQNDPNPVGSGSASRHFDSRTTSSVRVSFGAVTNYSTPVDQNVACVQGQTQNVTGTYLGFSNVSLSKTANVSQASVGGAIQYTLTYGNTGAGPGISPSIVDTFDSARVTMSNLQTGCVISGGNQITCTPSGPIAPGATGTFTYTGTVNAGVADGTTACNNAVISVAGTDIDPNNNRAPQVCVSIKNVDLTITKTANPTTAQPGDTITYTISYTNTGTLGSADATGVTISDPIPASLTNVVINTPNPSCTFAASTITCNVGNMARGATGTFTYTATVAAGTTAPVENTATISSAVTDAQTSNNSSKATVQISQAKVDMSIVKSADAIGAGAGLPITYTLTYKNTGGTDATNAVIRDVFDAKLTNVTMASGTTGCAIDQSAHTVTCNRATVAKGGVTSTITYSGVVAATATTGQTLHNDANITSSDQEATPADNLTHLDIPIRNIDLTIDKTASPSSGPAGTVVTYTITFGNNGTPGVAGVTGVVISDPIPAALTNVTLNAPNPNCTFAGGTITCAVGTLGGNAANQSFSYTATVAASASGTVSNTATISTGSGQTDGNPANNTKKADFTVTPNTIDLQLTKTANTNTPAPDSVVTYTLTYSNNTAASLTDATGVVITDDYEQAKFTGPLTLGADAVAAHCTDDGNIITCNVGTVAHGPTGTGTISYSGHLLATLVPTNTITNTATISAANIAADANPANNNPGPVVLTVPSTLPPDLAITKTASPTAAGIGATVTYTLAFGNNGALAAGSAAGVTIVDNYDETRLTNVTMVSGGAGCTITPTEIDCNVGTLNVNQAGTPITYTAVIGGAAALNDAILNTAIISPAAGVVDASAANNTATSTVTVGPNAPDLTIAKTASVPSATRLQTITYTLTFTNNGAQSRGQATNVSIVDNYDQNLLSNIVVADPRCTDNGDTITCAIGTMAQGATPAAITYTAIVRATAPITIPATVITNTATISATEADAANADNVSTANVNVTAAALHDLTLAKAANPTTANRGATVTYTLTYGNNGLAGNQDAANAVITDDYDQANMTLVLPLPAGCADSVPAGIITCNAGNLTYPTNPLRTFVYTATVKATAALNAVITNTAVISATGADANNADNTSTANVTVSGVPLPDLTLVKSEDKASGAPNTVITYSLVYGNDGASAAATATGVTITDDYDQANLTLTGPLPAGCADSVPAGVITCNVGTLTVGSTGLSFSYAATVKAGTASGTLITNTANILLTETDANTNNNQSGVTFTVNPGAPDLTLAKNASPAQGPVNTAVTYTLTFGNNGALSAGAASNVQIVDNYDETKMTITGALPAGCADSVPAGLITCAIGALPSAPATFTRVYTAIVKPGTPLGAVQNLASITSTEADANNGNNSVVTTFTVVPPQADMIVVKTSNVPSPQQGSNVTYTLTYNNAGGANATSVVITDDYDQADATLVGALPAGCTDSVPAGVITCVIGTVTPGSGSAISYVLQATGAIGNVIGNTATVTSTSDSNPANNTSTVNLQITPPNSADMRLVKSASNLNPLPGATVQYTLTFQNLSPSDGILGAVINDDYDQTNMTLSGALPANCTDSVPAGVITCVIGDVPAGTPVATRVYSMTVGAGVLNATNIVNTATINAANDTNGANNTSVVTVTTSTLPDMSVTKTANPATTNPGSTVNYTLAYRNFGGQTAVGTTVTDDYDQTNMTIAGALPAGCTDSVPAGVITCAVGAVPGGASNSIFYSLTVNGATPNGTSVNNTATVANTNGDLNAANNTSNASVLVSTLPLPDMTIVSKVPSTTTPAPGATVSYVVTYDNIGALDASGVAITDDYDQTNMTVSGALPAGCADSVPAGLITCNVGVVQAANAAQTLTYSLTVNAGAAVSTVISNTATVTTANGDSGPGINSRTANVTVTPIQPDMTLTSKNASTLTPSAGSTVTYTVNYNNVGGTAATAVVITDDYDQVNMTLGALPAGCTDSVPAGIITCAVGNVNPSTPGSVVYPATVKAGTALGTNITNTATVASAVDNSALNNTAARTVQVAPPSADMTLISKVPSNATPLAGSNISYTITYDNIGAVDATGVAIVDDYDQTRMTPILPLPAGCTDGLPVAGVITCTIGTVTAAAAPATLTYFMTVGAAVPAGTQILNSASVLSVIDGNAANNTAPSIVTVAAPPDMSLVKIANPIITAPGSPVNYSLTYQNLGGTAAQFVTIVDDYDQANVTLVPASLPANCVDSVPAGAILCTIAGNVAAGAPSVTLNYTANVKVGIPNNTVITNTATVASALDSNAGNNTSTANVTAIIAPLPDMALVSKVPNNAAPTAGSPVTYTVTFDNLGPGNATGVAVFDDYDQTNMTVTTLPAGCADSVPAGIITCAVGNVDAVPPSQTLSYTLTVNPGVAANTVISNTATVTAANGDSSFANNQQTATATVSAAPPSADISLTGKTANTITPAQGTAVTYTIDYNNLGALTANSVVVTDDYDQANMTLGALPAGCTDSIPAGVITCNLGSVNSGTPGTIVYTATVKVATPIGTVITNNASVASAADSNGANNTATRSVTVSAPGADMTLISKVPSNATPLPGSTVIYTITYDNIGALDAAGVSIVDDYDQTRMTPGVLPAGCTDSVPAGVITCAIGNVLAASPAATLTYDMTVGNAVAGGTQIQNSATVNSTIDTNGGNNGANAIVTVAAGADMSLTKTANPLITAPLGTVTYTLTYRNLGGVSATGVTITDDYDQANVTLTGALPAGCTDSVPAGVITCAIGNVAAASAPVSLSYNAIVSAAAVNNQLITNTATVASASDINAANNTASATVTVSTAPLPDMTVISKTASNLTPLAGAPVIYTLTLDNIGVGDATGVTVTDDYDQANMTVTTLPAGCADSVPAGIITCAVGNVPAANASQTLTYTLTVNPGALANTVIGNTATITSGNGDISALNNSQTATVTVLPAGGLNPDMTIVSKTANNATPGPGTSYTYTVTYDNIGAVDATAVVITDTYDRARVTLSNFPAGCVDNTIAGTLTCNIGSVFAASPAATLTYTATVGAAVPFADQINNNVVVTNGNGDGNPANNAASTFVTVANPATTADMTIVSKTVNSLAIAPGGLATYTITYDNVGGADAAGVTITDDYDQATLTLGALPAGCTDSVPAGVITCVIGAVTAAAPATQLVYSGTVGAAIALGTPVTNNARIASTSADFNISNNNGAVTFTVALAGSDMTISSIALSAGSNPPVAGATENYDVNYKNLSATTPATGVTIDLNYDETKTSVVVVPANCVNNTPVIGTMRCNVANVAPNGTGTLTFPLTYFAGTAGQSIALTATVNSAADGNPANNSLTFNTLVQSDYSVTKTTDKSSVGGNEVIHYTITVTRNTAAGGPADATISDTISGAAPDVISGNSGGSLTYTVGSTVINGGASCAGIGGNTDIAAGPITCTLGGATSTAKIEYDMRSSNNGVNTGATSAAANTASAAITGIATPFTAINTVSINNPVVQPCIGNNCGNNGGGGGGGGGGGEIGSGGGSAPITGTMEVKIEKQTSFDGKTWFAAGTQTNPVIIPEKKSTRLYNRVTLTNLSQLTATNIDFRHTFDQGDTDMTSPNGLEDLKGATYLDKEDIIRVDELRVGETRTFTYSVLVVESGQNSNEAKDALTLVDVDSKLPATTDRLTYLGLGLDTVTYLRAGNAANSNIPGEVVTLPSSNPVSSMSNDYLSMSVQSSSAGAHVGDPVTFNITVKNISDGDLTGLSLAHDYDESALRFVNAFGGRDDGREVQWERAILRPGEVATFQLNMVVKNGAPLGTTVHALTRILVSQFENPAPVDSYLDILGGASAATPDGGRAYQLAQTGPVGMLALLALMALAATYGYKQLAERRYAHLKRLALQPL